MKKSKIILIIVFIVAAAVVLYFAWGVAKKRYFPLSGGAANQKNETPGQPSGQGDASQGSDQNATPSETDSSSAENTEPGTSRLFVTKDDCDKDCAKFGGSAEDLKYCQEVCGIIPAAPKSSEEECANLEGLDKDYCWRDLAVSKKDFTVCDKIGDSKLKKVCLSRVAEEILN